MRTRIIMQKPKYSVNTDNKVVVCTIKCELDLLNVTNRMIVEDSKVFSKLPMVDEFGCFTVKAKSRCHPSDTFDIVKGRLSVLKTDVCSNRRSFPDNSELKYQSSS